MNFQSIVAAMALSMFGAKPLPTGRRIVGQGRMRAMRREAAQNKHRAELYADTPEQEGMSRQQEHRTKKANFRLLRSERKKYAMRMKQLGGSAVIR